MANPASWTCPNCRRRVPRYATTCHCGARRTDAAPADTGAAGPPLARAGGWRQLPWSMWLALGIAAAAVIALIVLMFLPPEPPPRIPLLGHIDRAPTPVPRR
jgi:hypothetical protein